MSKGSKRRRENTALVEANWPFARKCKCGKDSVVHGGGPNVCDEHLEELRQWFKGLAPNMPLAEND